MHKKVLFHIDIDSPQTLLRFWGREDIKTDLDRFYDLAMGRALDFFDKRKIPLTIFCVGQELESCRMARESVRNAHARGHEIANHTYSHPYGFTTLPKPVIESEIDRCSAAIESVTGEKPIGFRAPSYDIDHQVINMLEAKGYLYDTSATWNILLPAIKIYHKLFFEEDRRAGIRPRFVPRARGSLFSGSGQLDAACKGQAQARRASDHALNALEPAVLQ
jgi:peptidoglycan/xylan/chitin deacetylase (PgdA/CDA1 family)